MGWISSSQVCYLDNQEGGEKTMPPKSESKTIRAGAKTYFFDLKKTKHKKLYLMITESNFKGEGEDRERKTLIVFPESAKKFAKTVSQMVSKLG